MQATMLAQQQQQLEDAKSSRDEQRRLREAAERQQAELAREAQEHTAQMEAAIESKRRQMDEEFARRQKAQFKRLSASMTQLLGEGLGGVAVGLLYRFNVWRAAVHEVQEERQAGAKHRERVEAERQKLLAVMETKQRQAEEQIAAQQRQPLLPTIPMTSSRSCSIDSPLIWTAPRVASAAAQAVQPLC